MNISWLPRFLTSLFNFASNRHDHRVEYDECDGSEPAPVAVLQADLLAVRHLDTPAVKSAAGFQALALSSIFVESPLRDSLFNLLITSCAIYAIRAMACTTYDVCVLVLPDAPSPTIHP